MKKILCFYVLSILPNSVHALGISDILKFLLGQETLEIQSDFGGIELHELQGEIDSGDIEQVFGTPERGARAVEAYVEIDLDDASPAPLATPENLRGFAGRGSRSIRRGRAHFRDIRHWRPIHYICAGAGVTCILCVVSVTAISWVLKIQLIPNQ